MVGDDHSGIAKNRQSTRRNPEAPMTWTCRPPESAGPEGTRGISHMSRRSGRLAAADDGNAALELVILAPVLLALIGLVIAAGRTSIAQGSVDAAARDAARQASISLTPAEAQATGQASARAALRRDGLDCRPIVLINVSEFTTTQPGEPASVIATVRCAVSLSNLAL